MTGELVRAVAGVRRVGAHGVPRPGTGSGVSPGDRFGTDPGDRPGTGTGTGARPADRPLRAACADPAAGADPGPGNRPPRACADPAARPAAIASITAEPTHGSGPDAAEPDAAAAAELTTSELTRAELTHDAPPAPPDALHMATNEPRVLLPESVRMLPVPVRESHSRARPVTGFGTGESRAVRVRAEGFVCGLLDRPPPRDRLTYLDGAAAARLRGAR